MSKQTPQHSSLLRCAVLYSQEWKVTIRCFPKQRVSGRAPVVTLQSEMYFLPASKNTAQRLVFNACFLITANYSYLHLG